VVLLISTRSLAANVSVGPVATGAGDGSDWSNIAPWSSVPLVRGNVYFLQSGTYGSKVLDTAVAGSTYVSIKKATASAHGAEAGWLDSYGTGTADFGGGASLTITTSYWDIDGVTGGGPGSWQSGHGITFNNAAGNAIDWISIPADPVSNLNLRHCSFTQTGDPTQNATFANVVNQVGSSGLNDSVFEYLYVNNISGLPFFFRFGSGDVFQYNYIGTVCGASSFDVNQHCEVMVHWGMSDVQFRYNYVEHTPSSGGLVKNDAVHGDPGHVSDRFRIYGNVFEGRQDGIPIVCNDGQCANWTIINNTFHDIVGGPFSNGGAYAITNLVAYNNIVFNAWGMIAFFAPYSWYSRLNGSPNNTSCQTGADASQNVCTNCVSGCDTVTETLDPFVSSAGHALEDFRLAGPITEWPGMDVCASIVTCDGQSRYDIDAFGNRRGADGTWDRGALELCSDATSCAGPDAGAGGEGASPGAPDAAATGGGASTVDAADGAASNDSGCGCHAAAGGHAGRLALLALGLGLGRRTRRRPAVAGRGIEAPQRW